MLQKVFFSFILHPELNVAQDRVFITGHDIYESQHVLYRRSFLQRHPENIKDLERLQWDNCWTKSSPKAISAD